MFQIAYSLFLYIFSIIGNVSMIWFLWKNIAKSEQIDAINAVIWTNAISEVFKSFFGDSLRTLKLAYSWIHSTVKPTNRKTIAKYFFHIFAFASNGHSPNQVKIRRFKCKGIISLFDWRFLLFTDFCWGFCDGAGFYIIFLSIWDLIKNLRKEFSKQNEK